MAEIPIIKALLGLIVLLIRLRMKAESKADINPIRLITVALGHPDAMTPASEPFVALT